MQTAMDRFSAHELQRGIAAGSGGCDQEPGGNHLGLDDTRFWITLAEANLNCWPSPEMRQVPGHFDHAPIVAGAFLLRPI